MVYFVNGRVWRDAGTFVTGCGRVSGIYVSLQLLV